MWLFRRKYTNPIRVNLNVRAFVGGQMARLSLDTTASEGNTLQDLLKKLRREHALEGSVVRHILEGSAGVTVLRNGQRLAMPEGARVRLTDGDELSIVTTVAGG